MNILFFLTPKEKVSHIFNDDTLRQVVEKMEFHGYSAIPLLDKEGKYIGTITEGDLLWYLKDHDFPDIYQLEDIPITDIERKRVIFADRINKKKKYEDSLDRPEQFICPFLIGTASPT